jgi:hypothetical protein
MAEVALRFFARFEAWRLHGKGQGDFQKHQTRKKRIPPTEAEGTAGESTRAQGFRCTSSWKAGIKAGVIVVFAEG